MAKQLTDIEKELQEMAVFKWDKFVELVGLDVTKFVICNKKKSGKSIRQIATSVGMGRDKVHRICRVCP